MTCDSIFGDDVPWRACCQSLGWRSADGQALPEAAVMKVDTFEATQFDDVAWLCCCDEYRLHVLSQPMKVPVR